MNVGNFKTLLELKGIEFFRECVSKSSAYDTHVDCDLNFIRKTPDGIYSEDLDGKYVKIETDINNFTPLSTIRLVIDSIDCVKGDLHPNNSEEGNWFKKFYDEQGLSNYV